MKILCVGDICALKQAKFSQSIRESFHGTLLLGNLETPLESKDSPQNARPKAGPYLKGSSQFLTQLRLLTPNICLSLANNHIMDYSDTGLFYTIEECRKADIVTVGARQNLIAAQEPAIFQIDGITLGIFARCETQFGIASTQRAGVAPLDATLYNSIRTLRKQVDILIVSIHAASELCPWPSPAWQDIYHSYIDAGAHIVHGHHSHIPQGIEQYHGGLIFYGLGNFLVNPQDWQENHHALWSTMVECHVQQSGRLSYQLKTVKLDQQQDGTIVVRQSTPQEYNSHQVYLECCNSPLKNRQLLQALWQESAIRMFKLWYANWLHLQKEPSSIVQRIKNWGYLLRNGCFSKVGRQRQRHTREMLYYHLFACESHAQAITTALGVLSGELEDYRTEESTHLADSMMPWSCMVK